MRALILAAGRGSRLGTLTSQVPKCLVNFYGRPLLSRALDALNAAGVSEVCLVTGYRHEQLESYNLSTFVNNDWEKTGIFYSCSCADSWLTKDRTLILYSDLVFSAEDVARVGRVNHDLVVAYDPHAVELWRRRFVNPLDDLETFQISTSGRILDIGGRPKSIEDVEGQYTGILSVSPNGWASLKSAAITVGLKRAKTVDMTTLLRELIFSGVSIIGVPLRGPWGEIDSEHDLMVLHSLYSASQFH